MRRSRLRHSSGTLGRSLRTGGHVRDHPSRDPQGGSRQWSEYGQLRLLYLSEIGGDHFLTRDPIPGYSDEDTLPTTVLILYGPDPAPLDASDNEVLCTVTYPPRPPYFDPNGDGKEDNADDLTGDGVLDWDDLDEPYVAD